jgi:iron complex transport system substrate-binding protein
MKPAKSSSLARRALVAAALVVALAAVVPAAQAAPKRIVALTPFSANTLVGLGVKPIAIGDTPSGKERLSSKLKGVKTLTLSHPNGPNMEELALLDPNLVFSSMTWRKGNETMRDLDVKVVLSDPRSVKAVYVQTVAIAKTVGKESKGKALAASLKRKVAKARKGIKRKKPKVLMILGVGRTPFVMLPNSWGGDIVRQAGGKLLTAGVRNDSGFARISDEAILKANPDVIIAVPHADSKDIPKIRKHLESNPAWENTKAVENGRLHVTDGDSLLQANTDVASVIRSVRKYLKN